MFTYTDLILRSTNESHPDLILTILFGITGGLLSLVGLIAIFVSINSQHNLERAKEVLWSLQSFEIDMRSDEDNYNNKSNRNKLKFYFGHYKDLVTVSRSIKFVITIAIVTIIFVGVSWVVFVNKMEKELSAIEYNRIIILLLIGILILLSFVWLLLKLTNITSLGQIPDNLLKIDFDKHKNFYVDMPYLYIITLGIYFPEGITLKTISPIDLEKGFIKKLRVIYTRVNKYNPNITEKIKFQFPDNYFEIKNMRFELPFEQGYEVKEGEFFCIVIMFFDNRTYEIWFLYEGGLTFPSHFYVDVPHIKYW